MKAFNAPGNGRTIHCGVYKFQIVKNGPKIQNEPNFSI